MNISDLIQDIKTLNPSQQESVFSFVYLLKHPGYLHTVAKQNEKIEAFTNEREALDFVNDYAEKTAHEAW